MINFLKVGLVMMAGLGSTWIAYQVAGPEQSSSLLSLAQAQEPQQQDKEKDKNQEPAATPPDNSGAGEATAGAEKSPAPIQDMSREEMEAELKRAQEELKSGNKEETGPGEFRSRKPLPADLSVALPSDI